MAVKKRARIVPFDAPPELRGPIVDKTSAFVFSDNIDHWHGFQTNMKRHERKGRVRKRKEQ